MEDNNYYTVQGWMINKLSLKGNELILYAIIYGFSQDDKSEYHGSISYIQKALTISRPTVIKTIKALIEKGLIKRVSESHYMVVKKLYQQDVASKETLPVASKETLPVASKETLPNIYNTNNNTNNNSCVEHSKIKENNEIRHFLSLFKSVNPSYRLLFSNRTERGAMKRLLEAHGDEKVSNMIAYLQKSNGKQYFPTITTPYELEMKLGKLIVAIKREQGNNNKSKVTVI